MEYENENGNFSFYKTKSATKHHSNPCIETTTVLSDIESPTILSDSYDNSFLSYYYSSEICTSE